MNIRHLLLLITISTHLTGCRTWDPHQVIESPWRPPVLSKEGCPILDGKYQGEELAKQFTRFSRMDYKQNRLDINAPLTIVVHRQKPYLTSRKLPDASSGWVADDTQEKIFETRAITTIHQRDRDIDVVSTDNAGVIYTTMTLKLDYLAIEYPHVGCLNGAIVYRNISVYGSEGALGVVEANEAEYRKLSDGNIQITKRSREWSRSRLTGKAIGLPKESSSVQLFHPIP